MASIDDFVQAPSDELLDEFTKDQLLDLAKHYQVVTSSRNKGAVKSEVRKALVDLGVLMDEDKVDPSLAGAPAPPPVNVTGLSFDQQKQLLELQWQRDKWAAEVEREKLEQQERLELERLKVEIYRLDLVKEGKISGDAPQPISPAPHSPGSGDISHSLRLCPEFNESDPDSFFLVFERVADIREWSDEDRTLLLQCVLTGKGQEAVSALSSTVS